MSAKNRVNIFSSFLDIRQNVEWPRFFWPTLYVRFTHLINVNVLLVILPFVFFLFSLLFYNIFTF